MDLDWLHPFSTLKLAAPSDTATEDAVQEPCGTAVDNEGEEQAVNYSMSTTDRGDVVEDTDYEGKYFLWLQDQIITQCCGRS